MSSAPHILIVEDNDDDYEACVTALTQDHNLANPMHRCVTGEEALDYLLGRSAYADPRPEPPSLILLDLNLPGTDGREVLAEIKSHDALKIIPVVVMTTSRDEADIDECYRTGANSYVLKPVNLNGFFEAIAKMRDYWLQIVVLPRPK